MEAVKQQILGLAGWSDKEKGKAIFKLSDSNVRNLANLPDSVLKGALEELLAESKLPEMPECCSCNPFPWDSCQVPAPVNSASQKIWRKQHIGSSTTLRGVCS